MSKQTTQGFIFTGEMFTASVRPWQELPFNLCFTSGTKLTLNPDGSATFEGDADEAAQMFFDNVIKLHNSQYQKLEAAEKHIAELEISRDKSFLSGLKSGWEYGIADDTEGYNREIADAKAVIDRTASVTVEGE